MPTSKKDFEREYCVRSGITINEFRQNMVVLPCHCGEKECEGWAAISANSRSIKDHMAFYGSNGGSTDGE